MLNPLNMRIFCLIIGFLPFFSSMTGGTEFENGPAKSIEKRGGENLNLLEVTAPELSCTKSNKQIVYSSEYANPIVTISAPIISGKSVYLKSVDLSGDTTQINLSTKSISLIVDLESKIPGFLVFNKRGKSYCSVSMGLLDFPNHFSYRCLTKDRKIITAGYQKSSPIIAHEPVRKLVNDNINKADIDLVLSDNIVLECYKSSNWLGESYTINVNVSPLELDYYKDDIIALLNEDYSKLDNAKQLEDIIEDEGVLADIEDEIEVENTVIEKDIIESTEVVPEQPIEESKKEEISVVEDDNLEVDVVESKPENEVVIADAIAIQEEPIVEQDNNLNLGTRNIPKLEDSITPEEKEAIQREAEDKLYRLQDCFVMLVNRNYNAQQKKRERETTVQDLFINERANVGVSSARSDVIKNYLIGNYLLRLERMITGAYQKVEIVFSEIHKVSNFKKNPDGTWSATVTFSQQFTGFSDLDGQQVKYSDMTQKSVTVIIRRVELFTGNSTPEVYWEVLLSDIGVNQTQAF